MNPAGVPKDVSATFVGQGIVLSPRAFMQVIRVWARILEALPTARLLLKNKPFACESARAHTLGLLAAEVPHTLQHCRRSHCSVASA